MIHLANVVVLLRLTLPSFRAQEHPFLKNQLLLAVLHQVMAMVIGKAGTTARKLGLHLSGALLAETSHEQTLCREHQVHPQQDCKRRKLPIHPPSVQIHRLFLNL